MKAFDNIMVTKTKIKPTLSAQAERFDKLVEFGRLMRYNRQNGIGFDKTAFRYAVKENLLSGIDHFQINEKLYHKVCYSKEGGYLNDVYVDIAIEGIWAKIKEKFIKLKAKIFGKISKFSESADKKAGELSADADELKQNLNEVDNEAFEKPRRVIPWKKILMILGIVGTAMVISATIWSNWSGILSGASSVYGKLKTLFAKIPAAFKKGPIPNNDKPAVATKNRVDLLKYNRLNVAALKEDIKKSEVVGQPSKFGWAKESTKTVFKPLGECIKFLKSAGSCVVKFATNLFTHKKPELGTDAPADDDSRERTPWGEIIVGCLLVIGNMVGAVSTLMMTVVMPIIFAITGIRFIARSIKKARYMKRNNIV